MASKRRASHSDDEDDNKNSGHATPISNKRARTVGFDSDPEVHYIPSREKKGKGKARQTDGEFQDSEEEAVNDPAINNEEEEQFESEHADIIRAAITSKRTLHGGVAEHGIIESIEMHQFMCHKYLSFKFGEQINFIIGQNGSGKSAVLSAITVALGGKATSTGRGTGVKSFIREGQAVSEVTIQLKNRGDEAYKPKEYGKSIFITRRFTKDGSSTWKIKSFDGRLISAKKEELSAICDHMNIQVDNPMNVLTQDAARQFLSASQPAEKYKFFLRGTQLGQLSEEYDTCLENIGQTARALQQKREALPDLKATFKEASARFEEASKAREQKKKADDLKKELAWAHVGAKEEEMRKKFEDVAKATRRLPKIQEGLATAKAAFDSTTDAVTLLEAEHHALGDIEHLNAQKTPLNEQMRVNKAKIAEFTADQKKMSASLTGIKKTIDDYQKRIDEEAAKMAVQTQAKREESAAKLQQAREEVQDADKHLKDVCDEKRAKIAERDRIHDEGRALEAKIKAGQNRVMEINETIARCAQKEKDQYVAYGTNIQGVLDDIQKMTWRGEVIGPLGMHVRVREPAKWGPLLRSQLGNNLTSFAVTNSHDREQLKALLVRRGNPAVQIFISPRDMFDYSQGEPRQDLLTVLRTLEIDDPWVLRVLINASNIERVLVAPTRREGQNMLSNVQGGGVAWTADMFRVNVYPEGGGATTMLQSLPPNDRRNLMFSQRSADGDVQHWRNELAREETALQNAQQELQRLQQTYNACRRAVDRLTEDEKLANARVRNARAALASLQEEANSDMPVAIASLEAAKEEAIKERDFVKAQFEASAKQKAEVDEAQKPLLTELNKLKAQIDEFEGKRAAIATQIEDAVAARLEAQNQKSHYEKKLIDEQAKVDALQQVANDLQGEFVDWTAKAEQFCTRYENPRLVDVVQRNLASVQRALEQRERRHGATVEEMTIEVNKAKANLDNAQRELDNMAKLNKALRQSLIIRMARWQEFRRHIALRCKLVFTYHLSQRGYNGNVIFDHVHGTLNLKVQTDDQAATQSREKDPRSLSGGEKSFATICLLLSLWDSIGCPLRCLDEFDVFMDAVNRRISMKMMIDTANASDQKQYILITPQDMSNVQLGPTVRVNRMPDPERGQALLSFGS